MIWTLRNLIDSTQTMQASKDGRHWYPARPMNLMSIGQRFHAAWLVFSGKGDVVLWPEPPAITPNPKPRVIHASDCALHNMPAYPAGPCDCGADPA